MTNNVQPNIQRDRCAVSALQIAIKRLDEAFPDQVVEESGNNRLNKIGEDINYMKMTLDLYRDTDWGENPSDNPFETTDE